MFAVLCPFEVTKERRFGRRRTVAEKSKAGVHNLSGAMRFYTVPVPLKNGSADWTRIAAVAGGCKGRILAPLQFKVPEGYGFCEYYSADFAANMIFDSALALLKSAAVPPQGLSISLIDPDALLADRVCDLLEVAAGVKAVTKNPQKFLPCAQQAMREYGATLVISGRCDNSSAVISYPLVKPPDGVYGIISAKGVSVKGFGADNVQDFKGVLPSGLDTVCFAAACARLCAESRMMKTGFESLICNSRHTDFNTAANSLARALGKNIG